VFLDATLTRAIPAAGGDAFDPAEPTEQTFACKAIHDGWSSFHLANNLVAANERKVMILASTLATTPVSGDMITIRGETFAICPAGTGGTPAVSTDPAKAVWTCRASA
jgi:hypothetical protein